MQVSKLLDDLGYRTSPNFLGYRQAAFRTAPDFGHIFRRAGEGAGLRGVYALRPSGKTTEAIVPVVYVCTAPDEKTADEVHRLVWNQDVVPFLIVQTPERVKLYCGFHHSRTPDGDLMGVLETLTDFNHLGGIVKDFHAESIDNGSLWRNRGQEVTPEYRVNWRLLGNLHTLDGWLRTRGVRKEDSHALIGKYVYLYYLRDRKILSPKKLARWGIEESSIFGRTATIDGLRSVVQRLDDWLNGSVFPLNFGRGGSFDEEHLRCIAGVFAGDDISAIGDRQLSLDFKAYDFSYIPIETLSVVYEQFLHASSDAEKPEDSGKTNRRREMGAYYTPIPVVNLMLAELEERRPFEKGMRVLDPSCGSGAFLVQCYRRLIEKEFPPGSKPKPAQLRNLLQASIFGIDVEADACNVAELSLALTLLDYVDPPDLEGPQNKFKLPALRGENIFRANFFDESLAQQNPLQSKFDWIVGNPPWKRLNPNKLLEHEKPVWEWMKSHKKDMPVSGNQTARAFAWEVRNYLAPNGEVGLFLPGMTLFEKAAHDFRKTFFRTMKVNTVINLANLAEVLSAGRFRVPSAAFFYQLRTTSDLPIDEDEFVRTYCPLVANQEPTRPVSDRTRNESWSIVINASEIRDIPTRQLADGSGLPWKLAMWGSSLDSRFVKRLNRKFRSLGELEVGGGIIVSEGLQLRKRGESDDSEELEPVEEVDGKPVLDVTPLKRLRRVFSFPKTAIPPVDPELKFARKGRATLPLSVCRPPHVIVSAARNFAVYSDEFLVVPPRQIGIVSKSNDKDFLKALSLYLSSDFAFYHQFLTSSELGVKRDRATLQALRDMPIGIIDLPQSQLKEWAQLHARLIQTQPHRIDAARNRQAADEAQLSLPLAIEDDEELQGLLDELNRMVSDSLRLADGEKALIHDLVHVRLDLNDGKIGKEAVRRPTPPEIQEYARGLKSELDGFIDGELPKRHDVGVVYDDLSGMVQIDLVGEARAQRNVLVAKADDRTARKLELTRQRLRQQRSQWVYFDRNLRIYEGTRTFVFKPMQRFHWTLSQAMIDAREIISETLEATGIDA